VEKLIEIAYGHPSSRGTLIPLTQLPNVLEQAKQENRALYRSHYLYDKEVYTHMRKIGSIKDYFGTRYIGHLLVDIDKQDNSHDQTLRNAIDVCNTLMTDYDVPDYAMQPFFSGSGYHILLSEDLFDFDNSKDLPYIVKNTMKGVLNGVCDPAVYMRSSIYRVAHTINHKTGMYKIPITIAELMQLSYKDIHKLAETPRNDFQYGALEANGELKKYIQKSVPSTRELSQVREPNTVVPCVQTLYKRGPQQGTRHNTLLRIASHFRRNGIPSKATKAALLEWNNNSLEEEKILQQVESVYRGQYCYGCNDSLLKEVCHTKCIYFKRKDYLVDIKSAEELQGELVKRLTTDFTGKTFNLGHTLGIHDKDLNIYPGELVTIFGPTGANKTTLAQNIALGYNTITDEIDGPTMPTLFLSLELSDWYMHRRNMQIVSGKSKWEVNKSFDTTYERNKDKLDHLVIQTISPTIDQVRDKVREIQPKCVVIDYIDLMQTPVAYKGEYEQIRYISHSLSSMAVNMDIIVIQISQVARDYSRNKVLDLYAGKGSGAIENASRKVIGINGQSDSKIKKVSMYKNSDGDLFEDIELEWTPSFRLRRVNAKQQTA
tara:strand:+ start:3600 stop:5405 length:1806 start_codon:yes stop_codon:yes gene_type:complete